MPSAEILRDKRILAVDDEPDILDLVQELLELCEVTTASDYESALQLLQSKTFDLIILDISGVNGFSLLEESRRLKMPAAMLTAHSMTLESVNRALKLGAVSFLPKDELPSLPVLISEIFQDLAEGKSHWKRLFDRLGPFFREKIGITWDDIEKRADPPYFY